MPEYEVIEGQLQNIILRLRKRNSNLSSLKDVDNVLIKYLEKNFRVIIPI